MLSCPNSLPGLVVALAVMELHNPQVNEWLFLQPVASPAASVGLRCCQGSGWRARLQVEGASHVWHQGRECFGSTVGGWITGHGWITGQHISSPGDFPICFPILLLVGWSTGVGGVGKKIFEWVLDKTRQKLHWGLLLDFQTLAFACETPEVLSWMEQSKCCIQANGRGAFWCGIL